MPASYRIRASVLLIILNVLAAPAQATMVLSNAIVHFEPGKANRQDVEISNVGAEPLYVEIEPRIVHKPGTDDESRELISNPREAGLLVTPNRMIVPPQSSKVLRFVNLDPAATSERVFRVTAKPVVGQLEAEQTGLKLLIAYEVLVIVQPQSPAANLIVRREGRKLHVRNDGNTNVLLREGYQCASDDLPDEQCDALPGKRIYPGNEWSLDLAHDRPVKYYQSVGTSNSVKTYP